MSRLYSLINKTLSSRLKTIFTIMVACVICPLLCVLAQVYVEQKYIQEETIKVINLIGSKNKNRISLIADSIINSNLYTDCAKIVGAMQSYKMIILNEDSTLKNISLSWKSYDNSCLASPIASHPIERNIKLKNDIQLQEKGILGINIEMEPITALKFIAFKESIFETQNNPIGEISLRYPLEELLFQINRSIYLSKFHDIKIIFSTDHTPIITNKISLFKIIYSFFDYMIMPAIVILSILCFVYLRKLRKDLNIATKSSSSLRSQKLLGEMVGKNIFSSLYDIGNMYNSRLLKCKKVPAEIRWAIIDTYKKIVDLTSTKTSISKKSLLSLRRSLEIAINVNNKKAIKRDIKLKPHFTDKHITLFADEIRVTLIISGIINKLLLSATRNSVISIMVKQNSDSIEISFYESGNFYYENKNKKDVRDVGESFNTLAIPTWESVKIISDLEKYTIKEIDDNGQGYKLTIPLNNHIDISNENISDGKNIYPIKP